MEEDAFAIVGEQMPQFAYADKDDKRYLAKDYVGKGKMLLFYFEALGETNVSRELRLLEEVADAYPQEMQVMSVFLNADKEKLTKLATERKYSFPLLLGNEKSLEQFKLESVELPAWLLADREGKVVSGATGEPPTAKMIEDATGFPPQPRIPGKKLAGERIPYFFARNLSGAEESMLPLIGNGKPLLLYFTAEKVEGELAALPEMMILQEFMPDLQMRLIVLEPSDEHRKELAGRSSLKDKPILFGEKVVADLYDTWGRLPMWVLADSEGELKALRPVAEAPRQEELLALLSGPQFPGEPVPFKVLEDLVLESGIYSRYAVVAAFSANGNLLAWNGRDRFANYDQLYVKRLREDVVTSEEASEKTGKSQKASKSMDETGEPVNELPLGKPGKAGKKAKDTIEPSTETEATPTEAEVIPETPKRLFDLNGPVKRITYADYDNLAPVWSPDGKLIAFHSDRSGYEEVWVTNYLRGGDFEQLSYFRKRAEFPSFTGDGQSMVVGADSLGDMDIWVLGSGGRNPYPLVVMEGDQNDPAVSPDGKYVVFTSIAEGAGQIWKVRSDGKELRKITNSAESNYMAEWSPDCKYVVFVSERSGRPELWISRADGSGFTQLTDKPGDKFFPIWNVDGEHLCYTLRISNNEFEIHLLTIEGWDPASVSVDRLNTAETAARKKTPGSDGTETEKRYDPRKDKEQGKGKSY